MRPGPFISTAWGGTRDASEAILDGVPYDFAQRPGILQGRDGVFELL